MAGLGAGVAVVRRRSVLLAGLLGAVGCSAPGYGGPERDLVVAAGERGGLYLAFAELLAAEIRDAAPGLRVRAVETEGSVANAGLVAGGQAQLGLMLADSVQAAVAGKAPFGERHRMVAIGRVYENYLQLVVRADGPIHGLNDVAGRSVSLGAAGSGAALVGDRVLAVAGLSPAPRVEHRQLAQAVAGLESGELDALLWSGGVPTPLIAELDGRVGIRLIALDSVLAGVREGYGPVYDLVPVPPGAYRATRETPTIGVANLLVCREDLPNDVAEAVARTLVDRSDRLVPQQVVGAQFLDIRALIATAGIALHPGAARAYRDLHG